MKVVVADTSPIHYPVLIAGIQIPWDLYRPHSAARCVPCLYGAKPGTIDLPIVIRIRIGRSDCPSRSGLWRPRLWLAGCRVHGCLRPDRFWGGLSGFFRNFCGDSREVGLLLTLCFCEGSPDDDGSGDVRFCLVLSGCVRIPRGVAVSALRRRGRPPCHGGPEFRWASCGYSIAKERAGCVGCVDGWKPRRSLPAD